jgi:hypothetical protein
MASSKNIVQKVEKKYNLKNYNFTLEKTHKKYIDQVMKYNISTDKLFGEYIPLINCKKKMRIVVFLPNTYNISLFIRKKIRLFTVKEYSTKASTKLSRSSKTENVRNSYSQ